MKNYDTGTIIRIDRLFVKSISEYVEGKIWAVVVEEGSTVHVPIQVIHGPDDALDEDEFDEGDRGRAVSEKYVPGYVWAALAQWRLSQ